MERADFADKLDLSVTAIHRIESGESTIQFAKLAEIARVLATSPNTILDFPELAPDRDLIKGLLQATLVSQGMPLEQARPLSAAALEVLDRPELRNTGMSLEDSARAISLFVLGQHLNK